ncbi:MAG: SAM-dependent chlorinase/fluorinase [Bacteroidales bacterium]|nr:SAM-dependent chlorinase/fluorinase [Bacteroidales bacterium]
MRPTITLISDWRLRDPYVAFLKAALLNTAPEAVILDITHHIDMYSIGQTAFLMKQSYHRFPEGSIHLMLTNTTFTSLYHPVLFSFEGHHFIGEDNGIFTMMFKDAGVPLEGRQLVDDTATSVEKMLRMVAALLDGTIGQVTTAYDHFNLKLMEQAYHNQNQHLIEGKIMYVDAFFNAITNIPVKMFKEAVGDRPFRAVVKSSNDWQTVIYADDYKDCQSFMLTDNPLGCLEIAYPQGKVSVLADINEDSTIEITYE